MAQLLNLTAKTGERGDTSYRIRYCSVFGDTNRLAVPSSRISYYISCAKLLVVPTYNIATLMDVEESINVLTRLAEIEQYFAEIASVEEEQAEREDMLS